MNELHSIGQSVFVTDKYFKAYFKEAIKEYNLNRAEAMSLQMLSKGGDLTDLHYDKGVLSRTLSSLESKDFITRKTNADDGRINDISLTEEAYSVGHKIDKIVREWTEAVTAGIEDKELLAKTLSLLAENARSLASKM